MSEMRAVFLEVAAAARPLVAARAVAEHWNGASSLPEFSVRGLAGHLVRCVVIVPRYLDADPSPEGEPIAPLSYYDRAILSSDINSDDHVSVRTRGEELASEGHGALVALLDAGLIEARTKLASAPPDRLVRVVRDLVLPLDDYLATRIVEIVVHADDLAHSVGLSAPELPDAAVATTIRYLVDLARLRHGDMAVVRALTRRERDEAEALRVF